ncbi:MAG: dUTP diphosphatase [Pseudohongiellaceae bacterium]
MLSKSQIASMLSLQARMNGRVDPGWVQARYPYLRAVVVEGAEAMEHHGWKWWKKQSLDLPQVQMELVDIWHFILSALLLEHEGDEERTLESLLAKLEVLAEIEAGDGVSSEIEFAGVRIRLAELHLLDKLELLIALAARRRIELAVFAAIMADCEMSWLGLYRQYVGKNVLNLFRQDNGYKEGHYQKVWGGREDNEHLVDILDGLELSRPDLQDAIYEALRVAYPA